MRPLLNIIYRLPLLSAIDHEGLAAIDKFTDESDPFRPRRDRQFMCAAIDKDAMAARNALLEWSSRFRQDHAVAGSQQEQRRKRRRLVLRGFAMGSSLQQWETQAPSRGLTLL
jgi:hypothetical protein